MCSPTRPVLCIREVLEGINKTAQNIQNTIRKIERDIVLKNLTIQRLVYYSAREITVMNGPLPRESFHAKLSRSNNINVVCG